MTCLIFIFKKETSTDLITQPFNTNPNLYLNFNQIQIKYGKYLQLTSFTGTSTSTGTVSVSTSILSSTVSPTTNTSPNLQLSLLSKSHPRTRKSRSIPHTSIIPFNVSSGIHCRHIRCSMLYHSTITVF